MLARVACGGDHEVAWFLKNRGHRGDVDSGTVDDPDFAETGRSLFGLVVWFA
jgi:hypothetical protein